MGGAVAAVAPRGVSFRPSLPVFAGGWRAALVRLEDWSSMTAEVELRKGQRRAPLIAVLQVDLAKRELVGKLPLGIDHDLAEQKIVSAVASRATRMRAS